MMEEHHPLRIRQRNRIGLYRESDGSMVCAEQRAVQEG